MSKKMLIDATHAEETRVVVVDGNKVEEFDFETVNKRQLAGNIYLAKVTRVEPSLQAAFVDYGGNRHGFLAFAEIHPDYYQIPVADRKALIEEERAIARAEEEEENRRDSRSEGRSERGDRGDGRSRHRGPKPAPVETADAVISEEAAPEATEAPLAAPIADQGDIGSMDVVDLGHEDEEPHDHAHDNTHTHHDEAPRFRAIDHAADTDDEIESIAEEDVHEEIAAPRKPRARRYKIQEVIKVRQIMLVQVVKEERGNKGAALTTYLSLAGRYCVLMPNTARGGGISRKITMAADRKKLKEIAGELEVPEGAGLIIRTAGAKRTKPEIKRDYEYLMRLWEEIRELTLKSIAPAKIYEEGDLIKRTIRDLYSREIDEILVEGEAGYRTAKDFMKMIMPAQSRVVQPYHDATPLFARYQVEGYLGGMFNPTVQLKSGGYIVIGVTEALVAIDVNSGRATKEGSIEETALKTNIEAAEEIARQLRLRDLAGLIVIDFIDMEERRNNLAVEKRLKDKLKTDRARIQVGRISGFGLLEMSRQRLRPGMLESTTQPCAHCHGTGLIRSDDSIGLQVLRALEEEGTRKRSKEVLLRAPIGIVNFLFNQKREHLALIEARYGMAVRIEADPHMIAPDFTIEKFKTATRFVPDAPVVSGNASLMGAAVEEEDLDLVEEDIEAEEEATETEASESSFETTSEAAGSGGSKKKRRRRRKKKPSGAGASAQAGEEASGDDAAGDEGSDDGSDEEDGSSEGSAAEATEAAPVEAPVTAAEPEALAEAPKKRTRTSSSRAKKPVAEVKAPAEAPAEAPTTEAPAEAPAAVEVAAEAPAKPARKPATRSRAKKPAAEAVSETAPEAAAPQAAAPQAATPEAPAAPAVAEASFPADPGLTPAPEAALVADPQDKPEAAPEPEDPNKPKRKGWWSLGR